MRGRTTLSLIAALDLAANLSGQVAVKNQGYVPFSERPINYRAGEVSDPVSKLQKGVDRGEVTLRYEPGHGYLKSVLALLAIPMIRRPSSFPRPAFSTRRSPRKLRERFISTTTCT
ncbi:MAG: hypothetical protein JWO80_6288 [Bryobacterales bacterium]|nr:hypothetical protein [Bryobacterales bacterium]